MLLPATPTAAPAVNQSPAVSAVRTLGQTYDSPIDDPIEWASFGREATDEQGPLWESFVAVDGMYCAACAITIEKAFLSVKGVQSASVSAAGGKAKVVWRPSQTRPSAWLAAIVPAGYSARPLADAGSETNRRSETRQALWRWLVAGLCMMQVMMYAYPAYVATDLDLGSDAKTLLRWASWLLTLPVLLFSSGPFFTKAWRDMRRRSIGMDFPVALGILITFWVSTAGTFDPQGAFGKEVYFDSLTMFVFFLLSGRLLELRLRDKVFYAVDSALHKMPQSVERVESDGSLSTISAKRVRVGDVLHVPPGQTLVADGDVLKGNTLVNEAVLTGESEPLPKAPGQSVIAGSVNLTAAITMQVKRVGEKTRFGEIMGLMASAQTSRPTFAGIADRIAKPFLIGVLVLAAVTAVLWWPTSPDQALMAAVAVLIVTCPCALSLATPAALLASIGALAKSGILVKRMAALEALSQVDVIVFDKTGTLTQDVVSVSKVSYADGYTEKQARLLAASLAQHSMHPLSKALLKSFQFEQSLQGSTPDTPGTPAADLLAVTDVREVAGEGVKGQFNGDGFQRPAVAGQEGPVGHFKLGSASFCGLVVPDSAVSVVHLANENRWVASFEFEQSLREDAQQAVATFKSQGIRTLIFSGDSVTATRAISDQLGIDQAFGLMKPADKLAALQDLHVKGHHIAVVGDGINDALMLAAADVSVSLGSAVPLAQNQCDVLLQNAQLMDLVMARGQALAAMKVVRQNLAWALVYNLLAVPMAALGWLPAWLAGLGMAASSLLVIANAIRLTKSLNRETT